MKITVNVECTPEEARTFMGLPDLTMLNEQITSQIGEQITAMQPDKFLSTWMPMFQNMTQFWTGPSKDTVVARRR